MLLILGLGVSIVLFFVFAEVAPKTYAIQHTDRAALRVTPLLWFMTQFAFLNSQAPPFHQCVAVSQNGDPTGAYYTYDFVTPWGGISRLRQVWRLA